MRQSLDWKYRIARQFLASFSGQIGEANAVAGKRVVADDGLAIEQNKWRGDASLCILAGLRVEVSIQFGYATGKARPIVTLVPRLDRKSWPGSRLHLGLVAFFITFCRVAKRWTRLWRRCEEGSHKGCGVLRAQNENRSFLDSALRSRLGTVKNKVDKRSPLQISGSLDQELLIFTKARIEAVWFGNGVFPAGLACLATHDAPPATQFIRLYGQFAYESSCPAGAAVALLPVRQYLLAHVRA
jgi:hypothetical protein